MNKTARKRLVYKFLLFVLPFLVFSIVTVSAVLSWTNYRYYLATIKQDYSNIIKSSAAQIRLYVEDAEKNLESLALVLAASKLDNWQEQMALTGFHYVGERFISIALVSPEGEIIISVGRDDLASTPELNDVFPKALSGKNAVSNVKMTDGNIPFIHVAIPLFHLGKVERVLLGKLNLKSVWDVLEGIKIGETGQVSIVDSSGKFIAHREIHRVLEGLPGVNPERVVMIGESETPVDWIQEENKTKYFCLGNDIPDLDWIIVLSQSYNEIYAYLYKNFYWAAVVTCLVSLAAILVGWNRVNRFLMPIHYLHRQVQKAGRGDLSQKVSVDTNDEVGDLARAFNEMTVSLREYVQREVETAKELAHAKNLAILGTTSSKVTHEVGNLLNNVGLIVPVLKEENVSSRGRMALDILEKDSARISEFIHDFFQFAKKPKLHLERTSLEKVIREVLFVHETHAEQRKIRFELNWPSALPPVPVDSRLMYQVLSNLVKNSLDAMTGPGIINIEGKTGQNRLLVRIEDSGPGMDSHTLSQIFDPFFTTKGKRGTGLGLSIVRTIVEAHRGTIECRSEPGRGTTFLIGLPLQ